MTKLAITVMLVLLGCQEPFDMDDYIESSCVGNNPPKQTFYISWAWTPEEEETIADAFDHANERLGVDLQICGYMSGLGLPGTHMVAKMQDHKIKGTKRTIGLANGRHVYLWPHKMKGQRHLRKVILHELGHHLSGCGHSDNKKDVLAQGWWGVTEYTRADVERIMGWI